MKQGKTHKPAGKLNGSGSGLTKRDAAIAHSSSGGGTKVIDRTKAGHLKRSSGSFKKYG